MAAAPRQLPARAEPDAPELEPPSPWQAREAIFIRAREVILGRLEKRCATLEQIQAYLPPHVLPAQLLVQVLLELAQEGEIEFARVDDPAAKGQDLHPGVLRRSRQFPPIVRQAGEELSKAEMRYLTTAGWSRRGMVSVIGGIRVPGWFRPGLRGVTSTKNALTQDQAVLVQKALDGGASRSTARLLALGG